MWWRSSCRPASGERTCRLSGRWRGSAAWPMEDGWGEISARKGARGERSRIPVEEIAIQREPVFGALLGVELCGENVIPRQRAGKAPPVVALAHAVLGLRWARAIAVDEVEVGAVGHAAPDRVAAHLKHRV